VNPHAKLQERVTNALTSFNAVAQWEILRLPQMRQHLAEHLADALVPVWLRKDKQASAGEEIAHVLLMVGLFPPDWLDAYRAEVLREGAAAISSMTYSRYTDLAKDTLLQAAETLTDMADAPAAAEALARVEDAAAALHTIREGGAL
jgi:hypothetical protein